MPVTWMLVTPGHLLHSWDDLTWVTDMVVTVLPVFTGHFGIHTLRKLRIWLGSEFFMQYFSLLFSPS